MVDLIHLGELILQKVLISISRGNYFLAHFIHLIYRKHEKAIESNGIEVIKKKIHLPTLIHYENGTYDLKDNIVITYNSTVLLHIIKCFGQLTNILS